MLLVYVLILQCYYSKDDMIDSMRDFLSWCVANPQYAVSWGISDIRISQDCILFNVFGSSYQGRVTIWFERTTITVVIGMEEESFENHLEAICWIDNIIEECWW